MFTRERENALEIQSLFGYNTRVMSGKARISPLRWVFFILLGVGLVVLCCYLAAGRGAAAAARAEGQSIYIADAPLSGTPEPFIGGMVLLTPEQMARVPMADGFEWPCGTPEGAMMYDAQPFGADNAKRGGKHTGQDLNGIGGENTDLGEPVYAAARGLVVFSGKPSEDWGNVVVLAHRLPGEDSIIQTLYAHLDTREVSLGTVVHRGRRIGTIGNADGRYLAHLHFEVIQSRCTEAGMPGYHPAGGMNRLNPAEVIAGFPAPKHADAFDTVRHLRIREAYLSRSQSTPPTTAPVPEGAIPVKPSQFITP